MVAALLLSYRCIVTINVLWLFLTVPQVCLQCVIVVFPDHTHLCLLYIDQIKIDVTCFFYFNINYAKICQRGLAELFRTLAYIYIYILSLDPSDFHLRTK